MAGEHQSARPPARATLPRLPLCAAALRRGWHSARPRTSRGHALASSGNGSDSGAPERPQAPWSLTFDLRERETLWTEENQARLVRIVTGYQLNLSTEEVEQRLKELGALLPQLAGRVAYIKPATLAALLRNPSALPPRLISLLRLLPAAGVGALVASEPELLLLRDLAEIERDLERLGELLGPEADLSRLVQQQPRFLDAELVAEVLDELRRLVPGDPVATLLADPSWVLRVERGREAAGRRPRHLSWCSR